MDIRDIVCKTVFPNINSFLQECTSLCPKPGSQARHTTSHQSYGYHPHSSSHGNYHSNHTHRARYSTDYHQPRQSYSSHTPQGMDHTQSRQAYPSHTHQSRPPLLNQPTSQPYRRFHTDLSQVTCHSCKQQGHYANSCQNAPVQQPVRIEQPAAAHTQQHNTHTQRQPNSSNNKSVGKVDIMEFTPTHTDADNGHILNNHDEPEAFMTHGTVNNIRTDILLDSGANAQ